MRTFTLPRRMAAANFGSLRRLLRVRSEIPTPNQGPPPIVVANPAGAPGGPAGRGGGRGGLFSGTVGSVTPTAEAVTLREHYSLVELPDDHYQPRYDDPRAGYGGLAF